MTTSSTFFVLSLPRDFSSATISVAVIGVLQTLPRTLKELHFGAQGVGCLAKKARKPCRHSSVKRGAALACAASSKDKACREKRCRSALVLARAFGPPSA